MQDQEELSNVHRGGFLQYINNEEAEEESRNLNVIKEGNDTIKESLIEGDEDEDDEPQDLEGSDKLVQGSPENRAYLNANLANFRSNMTSDLNPVIEPSQKQSLDGRYLENEIEEEDDEPLFQLSIKLSSEAEPEILKFYEGQDPR